MYLLLNFRKKRNYCCSLKQTYELTGLGLVVSDLEIESEIPGFFLSDSIFTQDK